VLLRLSVVKHSIIQRVPMVNILDVLAPRNARIYAEPRPTTTISETDDSEYTQIQSSDTEDVTDAEGTDAEGVVGAGADSA
jgi:hypothetical protein